MSTQEKVTVDIKRYRRLGEGICTPHDPIPIETIEIELDREDCLEIRPDLGIYFPIVAFRKLERILKAKGFLYPIPRNQVWFFGYDDPYDKRKKERQER